MPVPRPRRTIATPLPSLGDLDVAGRRVLIRADLNVPLEDGDVADDFRITAFLPTLERVLERGGRSIVCSHLGRPKGPDPNYTLAPVAAAMSEALAGDVPLAVDYEEVPAARVVLLENLRFHEGETRNDPTFGQRLSSLGDAYVNDAFGSCHRAHASIVGPPAKLPSAAGLLLELEVRSLSKLLDAADRPYVVVLGGAKVADKLGVVRSLLQRADRILVGGGMCFTFLKAHGHEVGRSLVDEDSLDDVRALLEEAGGDRVVLPTDVVCAPSVDASRGSVRPVSGMPADEMGLDIGPQTGARFAEEIQAASTLFWNGPMGVFEKEPFAAGTRRVAEAVVSCSGYTATGGGDTAAALAAFGLSGEIDFASTGGGASLEFLEGKTLPGIEALTKER